MVAGDKGPFRADVAYTCRQKSGEPMKDQCIYIDRLTPAPPVFHRDKLSLMMIARSKLAITTFNWLLLKETVCSHRDVYMAFA